jgi:hypothetical protein
MKNILNYLYCLTQLPTLSEGYSHSNYRLYVINLKNYFCEICNEKNSLYEASSGIHSINVGNISICNGVVSRRTI